MRGELDFSPAEKGVVPKLGFSPGDPQASGSREQPGATLQFTPEQQRAILRNGFYSFIERSFGEVNPQSGFAQNWHSAVMAHELERCRRGQTKRLIINLPPRSLKSHCAS